VSYQSLGLSWYLLLLLLFSMRKSMERQIITSSSSLLVSYQFLKGTMRLILEIQSDSRHISDEVYDFNKVKITAPNKEIAGENT